MENYADLQHNGGRQDNESSFHSQVAKRRRKTGGVRVNAGPMGHGMPWHSLLRTAESDQESQERTSN